MTDADIIELANLYARQFGGTPDSAQQTMMDWSNKFRPIILEDAQKALMELAVSTDIPARPAGRISKILTMCLGTPVFAKKKAEELRFPACDICGTCGFVTVPHPNDYIMGEFWNGVYECAVACMCDAGARFRANHRTIANYEGEYPNWRNEWPLRILERRVTQKIPGARQELEDFFNKHKPQEVEQKGESDDSQETIASEDQSFDVGAFEEEVGGEEDRQGEVSLAGSNG